MQTVDDGSDQDYDSHIMVWQLARVNPNSPAATATDRPRRVAAAGNGNGGGGGDFPDIVVEEAEEAANSLASSSLDLGPTPGSGIITADGSESGGDEAKDEPAGSSPPASAAAWNDQIESMLNNVAAREDIAAVEVTSCS